MSLIQEIISRIEALRQLSDVKLILLNPNMLNFQ